MMFIDMPDGSVVMPLKDTTEEAMNYAKHNGGRLRLVIPGRTTMTTYDPAEGCIILGNWLESK